MNIEDADDVFSKVTKISKKVINKAEAVEKGVVNALSTVQVTIPKG